MVHYELKFRSIRFWEKIFFTFFMMAADNDFTYWYFGRRLLVEYSIIVNYGTNDIFPVNVYTCYKSFVTQKKMNLLQFQKQQVKGHLGNFSEGGSKQDLLV